MRIVITGGTGFLGSTAAQYFSQNKENEIIILGRDKNKGEALVSENISFQVIDLQEKEKLQEVLKHADYLIHSAAKSTLWGRKEEFFTANVLGTKNVLEAALENNVKKVIHISSPSIYTQFTDLIHIKEDTPLPRPINEYARTKLAAEQLVLEAVTKEQLDAIILRPRAIFGPGDTAIVPRLIEAGKKGIPKLSNTSPLIDATYVDNVVHAIALSIEKEEKSNYPVYNITNGEPRRIHDFIKQTFDALDIPYFERNIPRGIARIVSNIIETYHNTFLQDKEPTLTTYGICLFSNTQTMDISKAEKELGYTPIISIDEGIQRYANWYKEHEHN